MKTITYYLLAAVTLFAMQACSNNDMDVTIENESRSVKPESLLGRWFLTKIEGWRYDDDGHKHKTEFNKTISYEIDRNSYQYNNRYPIGDNIDDARLHYIDGVYLLPSEPGAYYRLTAEIERWNPFGEFWYRESGEQLKLKGRQLIGIYPEKVVIIKQLTDTTMITYHKDENGETYKTYMKLLR